MANTFKQNPNFHPITFIILHDLSLLCSFITSHPLYFSYFLFFSPYFIKLISFVSAPFIASVSLSLLLTTTTTAFWLTDLEIGILQTLINELKSNLDEVYVGETDRQLEDFEIYKIVFGDAFSMTICDEGDEEMKHLAKKILEHSDHPGCMDLDEVLGIENVKEISDHNKRNEDAISDTDKVILGVEKFLETSFHGGRRADVIVTDSSVDELEKKKGYHKLLEELDRFEEFATAIETKANSGEVTGELREVKAGPVRRVGSGPVGMNSSGYDNCGQNSGRSSSWRSNSGSSFNSYGSVNAEKEWRRTLACKLFEERHNAGRGEEGMDSLWEAYETDNSKNRKQIMINNTRKGMIIQSFCDEDDEDDDEEMSNGHLCCLQALKLSTRKMSLGMGKPKFVKMVKAVKGFGWLHHVKHKHGGEKS